MLIFKRYSSGLRKSITFSESYKIWHDAVTKRNNLKSIQGEMITKYVAKDNNRNNIDVTSISNEIGDGQIVNEIRISKSNLKSNLKARSHSNHLVMLHGFGASSLWYYKNMVEIITNSNGIDVINALDLPGSGLSSGFDRNLAVESIPNTYKVDYNDKSWVSLQTKDNYEKFLDLPSNFQIDKEIYLNYIKNQQESIESIENEYVDRIENWRKLNNVDRFDFLGHSFGSYIGLIYSIKYPHRVKNLALVSPLGLERSPYAITNTELINSAEKFVEYETSIDPLKYSFLNKSFRVSKKNKKFHKFHKFTKLLQDYFFQRYFEKLKIKSLFKILGPIGPKLLSFKIFKDFVRPNGGFNVTGTGSNNDINELKLFLSYIYNTIISKNFNEINMKKILNLNLLAKYPIVDRKFSKDIRNNNGDKKLLIIYGKFDWTLSEGGYGLIEKLTKDKIFQQSQIKIIENAGHNSFIDNSKEFNKTISNFFSIKK
ncbi:hypothetical protein BVG19_g377 [[Candida] boidinii]|nr:hypothetical protein BVG19_g377 [[Candida] boidinii]OWB49566.1 catalytic activity protein [[Candida] boidinii]